MTRQLKFISTACAAALLGAAFSAPPAMARKHGRQHAATPITTRQAPAVVTRDYQSAGSNCLSQGPADRNPCDPWYFKKTNPLIGGNYGE